MWANASIAIAGHVADVKAPEGIDESARNTVMTACNQIRAVAYALRDQSKPTQSAFLVDIAQSLKDAVEE